MEFRFELAPSETSAAPKPAEWPGRRALHPRAVGGPAGPASRAPLTRPRGILWLGAGAYLNAPASHGNHIEVNESSL